MPQEQWTAVDSYIADLFIAPDFALEAALDSSKAAGLPTINVSPAQGKLLHLLAKVQGARKILELGTLGGYRTMGCEVIALSPFQAAGAQIAREGLAFVNGGIRVANDGRMR